LKHLFIVHGLARANRKKKKLFDNLMAAIDRLDGDVEVQYTDPPEWGAEQIARAWAERGEPLRIYACGGDGTLNEVVNGAAGYDHVAVTNVPLGTGNDFLKMFGKHYRALFSDLPALMNGSQAAFDLMDCNGRLGIDVVCAGVDARTAADVGKYRDIPLVTGAGAYLLSLADNVLIRGICRPMRVRMGDRDLSGETAIICVCNGRHYGGGFMPVGEAMPDDGILDMLTVGSVSRRTFLRLAGKYGQGKYKDYPDLIQDYHGQSITYETLDGSDVVTVVDGEVMRAPKFTVKLADKKVNFFYPAGASYLPEGTQERAEELAAAGEDSRN
jgi:diacylglycerol kinase family enzyme